MVIFYKNGLRGDATFDVHGNVILKKLLCVPFTFQKAGMWKEHKELFFFW